MLVGTDIELSGLASRKADYLQAMTTVVKKRSVYSACRVRMQVVLEVDIYAQGYTAGFFWNIDIIRIDA